MLHEPKFLAKSTVRKVRAIWSADAPTMLCYMHLELKDTFKCWKIVLCQLLSHIPETKLIPFKKYFVYQVYPIDGISIQSCWFRYLLCFTCLLHAKKSNFGTKKSYTNMEKSQSNFLLKVCCNDILFQCMNKE